MLELKSRELLPDQARKLLEYRYSILDYARSRAKELAHNREALFPWRTIAGEEGSSYYPAGTARYHINAAIAYAIRSYIEASGDFSFMLDYSAEMLFETARLWEDLGAYIPSGDNQFCYNEVTGPDDYTALVICRYQVCKQPDVILAQLLLGECF